MTTITSPYADTTSAAMGMANASTQSLMDSTQDRFLTLLVTQLRNQDPLNPMDNAEVTSQIAQLSTVNGINQLNNTLLALSGQMNVSQSMQAANLIGKAVLVPGDKIRLGSDPSDPSVKEATPYGVDLLAPAAKVTASIVDASGQVVRQIDLGKLDEGVHSFTWDGKGEGGADVVDGAYSVRIVALDADDKPVSASALTYGKVSSVAYSSSGLRVDMGLAGSHSLLDIRKIM
ncbi:flagellar hook capping FlgD N-terminal domain-containing protein [Paracandidimonas soli]|uniref:Basal-body rod modification protein FlgD n=1 Tax=Paracandidimonas soli TaxID=1917182 RepID=A0A4R3V6Y9_9BURK|nr:flagellar hook capping FlgD N-terminal domain-containing protein [Paracandidimonas soli]TCV00806.1 flagellar basal-body rod modification protein FlgD [Paracandidimonas soli]